MKVGGWFFIILGGLFLFDVLRPAPELYLRFMTITAGFLSINMGVTWLLLCKRGEK